MRISGVKDVIFLNVNFNLSNSFYRRYKKSNNIPLDINVVKSPNKLTILFLVDCLTIPLMNKFITEQYSNTKMHLGIPV